ncbi:MAG: hypothetical protein EZS26_001056 [Candidatus Ordinivivax streblomastigis]|uniref:Uncharacterized protein n=1 Tax=Candidatus Ordinivivax streblomastigis TaxID=2540710 RepID=A0A5M8P3I4_9BACT|nr:MAG: hypothetical protein EZS26_001056 [Candidatus Ordinivivax streblomastigis]
MPKAQKFYQRRITKAPKPVKKRRKEDGRPRETYKKYKFEETKLGFFLKYEVPVVYDIIMNLTPPEVFKEPALLLVKMVCKSSSDPSLKKAKFFRYLEEYANLGLYCKRARQLTAKREAYYKGIQRKKTEKFIRKNRKKIEGLRNERGKFLL